MSISLDISHKEILKINIRTKCDYKAKLKYVMFIITWIGQARKRDPLNLYQLKEVSCKDKGPGPESALRAG